MAVHDLAPAAGSRAAFLFAPAELRQDESLDARELWQLVTELLPPRDGIAERFTLPDIAPLLGITSHALSKHARDLWPQNEGHWRLSHAQAVTLIRRVCWAGRKLPPRAQVLARLRQSEALQKRERGTSFGGEAR